MGIHRLPHGGEQPFYHVLVDERDRPGTHTTYVAQVCLMTRWRRAVCTSHRVSSQQHDLGRCRLQENILTLDGDRAKEISHPQIKRAFQVQGFLWMVIFCDYHVLQ